MRFLVLGCGSIGHRHAQNLTSLGMRDILAYDPDPGRRDRFAQESGARCVDNETDAWSSEPDVVVIATPSALHLGAISQAIARGCHLFVEKPLGTTLEGVPDLIAGAHAAGIVTFVGCNLRFHPGLRELRQQLASGAIGRPLFAGITFGSWLPDWHPWEDYRQTYSARRELGGGVVFDAIHEIDYARWLLGPVRSVIATIGRVSDLEIDTEDLADITAEFVGGAIGHIHLDYLRRPPRRGCEIVGENGVLRWDYWAGMTERCLPSGGRWETVHRMDGWEPNDMYLDEMRHFLECVRGETRPEQDLGEGAIALGVALAAIRSSAEGCRISVSTPEAWGAAPGSRA